MTALTRDQTLSAEPFDSWALDSSAVDGLIDGTAARENRPVPRSVSVRFVVSLVVAGLAGLLGGVDIIAIALLELVLRGTEADLVRVPGIGHAGWSFDAGFGYGFGPGAIAILVATSALGVALGWVVTRRREAIRA